MNEHWTAKPGDKIRHKVCPSDSPGDRRVLWVGEQIAVYSYAGSENSITIADLEHRFELVPEVFETGGKYVRNECEMLCLYADDTVAVLKNKNGAKYLRSQDSRSEYEVLSA